MRQTTNVSDLNASYNFHHITIIMLNNNFSTFLFCFFLNPSFKIAMSGRVGGHRASSEVYLLVNLFSKLYITFILQRIAFILGRDKEEDQ